jgi:TnpA family transposase
MAAATNTHSFNSLRIARWHVEGSAYDRALAMIVEAHAALPMAAFWGQGQSASSDGQFFLATEQGEAMDLINAKYGNVPGLKEIQPCVRSICAVRNPGDPGNGQRGSLYPGRAAHE